MATLTSKNTPDPLVKRLKQQAAAQHRSLNFQVISYLEQMTQSVPVDADIAGTSANHSPNSQRAEID